MRRALVPISPQVARQALILAHPVPIARVTDPIAAWQADMRLRNLSPNTIYNYVGDLRRFAKFLDRPLDTATSDDLYQYGLFTMQGGAASSTWGRRVSALQNFYDWLRRRQGRPFSIAQDLTPPKRTHSVHRWWTSEDVARFRHAFTNTAHQLVHNEKIQRAEACRRLWAKIRPKVLAGCMYQIEAAKILGIQEDTVKRLLQDNENTLTFFGFYGDPRLVVRRDQAMVELGLVGLRVSEVRNLNVEHVLDINRPLRAQIIVYRKGRKEQVLPLPEFTRKILAKWLHVRPAHVSTSALFFRLPFGCHRPDRLTREYLGKIFKKYARLAGVKIPPGIAFHHLRHTAGQRMADLGMNIEEAQRWLGHKSPTTTQVYYQVSTLRMRKTARRFKY